jgi:hypothetical protein
MHERDGLPIWRINLNFFILNMIIGNNIFEIFYNFDLGGAYPICGLQKKS